MLHHVSQKEAVTLRWKPGYKILHTTLHSVKRIKRSSGSYLVDHIARRSDGECMRYGTEWTDLVGQWTKPCGTCVHLPNWWFLTVQIKSKFSNQMTVNRSSDNKCNLRSAPDNIMTTTSEILIFCQADCPIIEKILRDSLLIVQHHDDYEVRSYFLLFYL